MWLPRAIKPRSSYFCIAERTDVRCGGNVHAATRREVRQDCGICRESGSALGPLCSSEAQSAGRGNGDVVFHQPVFVISLEYSGKKVNDWKLRNIVLEGENGVIYKFMWSEAAYYFEKSRARRGKARLNRCLISVTRSSSLRWRTLTKYIGL